MTTEHGVPFYSLLSRLDAQGIWFIMLLSQVGLGALHIFVSKTLYKWSLLSAACTYGIVVWKSFGWPRISLSYWNMVIINENFAYLMLAITFAFSEPQLLILIPFTVYSCFHVANYTRTSLLSHPYLRYRFSSSQLTKWSQDLKMFEEQIQTHMLEKIALLEILSFPAIAIGWILGFGGNLAGLIVLFQFLRLRFALSAHTQRAFHLIKTTVDHFYSLLVGHKVETRDSTST